MIGNMKKLRYPKFYSKSIDSYLQNRAKSICYCRRGYLLNKPVFIFCSMIIFFCLSSIVLATPEYAGRSGQGCMVCHIKPGGGALTEKGLEYAASGYVWPPQGGFRVVGPIKKSVRFVVGLLHIVAAFLWFGSILYVHILLRPGYASKGLPRGEVLLGLTSMSVVGITGTLLTISRIKSIEVLYKSPWGTLLSIKILLYIIMVSSAVTIVTIIGPRLKSGMKRASMPEGGIFDPFTLSAFDGKDKRPAYIAFKGKVYDVSALEMWSTGVHMQLHSSGHDLTNAISKAPHGEEKLKDLKVVGSYDTSRKLTKTPAQKAFYFIAYMNLILVFAVLFVIAFWRWGI